MRRPRRRHPRLGARAALLAAAAIGLAPPVGSVPAAGQVVPVSAISAARPEGIRALVTVDHLLLRGGSFREAMDSLTVLAPVGDEGRLANAVTAYDLMPHLVPVRRRGTCRPERLRVDVRVRTLLPEWVGRDDAPAGERRRWDAFIEALAGHEAAHRDITLRHAEALLAALRALEASSCPRLVRRIDGTIRSARAELRGEHAALDAYDAWAVHR